jgi:hypothetical protein
LLFIEQGQRYAKGKEVVSADGGLIHPLSGHLFELTTPPERVEPPRNECWLGGGSVDTQAKEVIAEDDWFMPISKQGCFADEFGTIRAVEQDIASGQRILLELGLIGWHPAQRCPVKRSV